MTDEDLRMVAEAFADALVPAMRAELDRVRLETELATTRAVAPVCERVAALEARPPLPGPAGTDGAPGPPGAPGRDGVDGMAGLEYCGVYVDGRSYDRGDLVTWGGSAWHCNEATATKPGDGSKGWTLMVKRGRDGKDAR